MQKGRQAMRRQVLCALVEHLEEFYNLELPPEASFLDSLTVHQVDALVAFKSDVRLDSLCSALERLDEGTFGACLSCKGEIEEHLLCRDPGRQLCAGCEQKFRVAQHAQQPWIPMETT